MRVLKLRWALIALALTTGQAAVPSPLYAHGSEPPTVLIIGSNRGIGFEIAKRYAAADDTYCCEHRKMFDGEYYLFSSHDCCEVGTIRACDFSAYGIGGEHGVM